MNISIKNQELNSLQGIIVPVYEDRAPEVKAIKSLMETEHFKGKKGECFYYTSFNEKLQYTILIGLGKYDELQAEDVKEAFAKAAKKAKELKINCYGVEFFEAAHICPGGRLKSMVYAMRLATYEFNKYKTDSEIKAYTPEVYILNAPEAKLEKLNTRLTQINAIVDGVIEARNLVNEPSNVMYPEVLAQEALRIGKEVGVEVEVFDEKYIQELGMDAFYQVGKGSDHKPRLIVMRYMGDTESQEILGFIGKGLTFDTGGYSLKPSAGMEKMKTDMAGAAAVIGAMRAIAENKVKANVVAVVAACENAISGGSYKPGDIIGSMAGKTIEILNTDAEGRLTLVDAVTYAIRNEKVTRIIDVATLTGAALVALGTYTTAVVTNHDEFYNDLMEQAALTGEMFWRLPDSAPYKKLIKSEVADLKNIGGPHAGTITAGLFIGEFVEGKPWLHLDIAGTSWANSSITEYAGKGATGAPVYTLYNMAAQPKKCGAKCSHE